VAWADIPRAAGLSRGRASVIVACVPPYRRVGPGTGEVGAVGRERVGRELPGGTAQAAVPPALAKTCGAGDLGAACLVFIACPREL